MFDLVIRSGTGTHSPDETAAVNRALGVMTIVSQHVDGEIAWREARACALAGRLLPRNA
jgi:hypothetical protein